MTSFVIITLSLFSSHNVLSEQIIEKEEPNTISHQNIQCNNEDPSCSIECIGDHSCTSYHIDKSQSNIHCPSTDKCELCHITCHGAYSCYNSIINLHNCTEVKIWAHDSYSLANTTIITDSGSKVEYTGNLTIFSKPSAGDNEDTEYILSNLTINNGNIANVTIHCYSSTPDINHECDNLKLINNYNATDIALFCHDNTDCSSSMIECPVDTAQHKVNDSYHSKCKLFCLSTAQCQNISVYAQHGMPDDFWFDCMGNDTQCTNSSIYCGKQYANRCDMKYDPSIQEQPGPFSPTPWYCDDIDDGQSCVNTSWVDEIRKANIKIKPEDFWVNTGYGIPMTVFAGVIVLCLLFVITKILRQRAKDRARGMMRYEIEDAQEADEQNKIKQFMRGIMRKIVGNKYGMVADDEYDDEEDYQRKVELENLEKMTKSHEDHDSDDDLDLDGIETGRNDNETIGYSYGHTFAVHDL